MFRFKGYKMGHSWYNFGLNLGMVLPSGLKLAMTFYHESVSFHRAFHL